MEPRTRGYTIPLAARFIIEDEALRGRLSPHTYDDLTVLAASKPDFWVPRQEVVRLWSIVDEASPDEASAYRNLVRGGEAVAREAISTFLKLLLRMLTPKQFARKFPDIWSHEHQGGFVEAVVGEHNTMEIKIRDVEGFSHIGPVATGFVGSALRAIGLKELQIRDVTWTRAEPGPRDARIEISWK